MRIVVALIGVILAAVGGVIAYRALFLDPHAAIVVTETNVRELPNMWRLAGGLVLFCAGAGVAFLGAFRRR
ncbi:MAG: hypothetical protein WCD76_13740 [Pyrinomonadaceae bacterium]